jgi:hypothetical protein
LEEKWNLWISCHVFYLQMIQCLFNNAKHCVLNIFHWIAYPRPYIDLSCWKARLNKLVTEVWYLHKHTMQVLNWRFGLSTVWCKCNAVHPTICFRKRKLFVWYGSFFVDVHKSIVFSSRLKLQDTLFAFCGKSLLRSQNQSDFHQIFTKCSPVHAKYGKVVKLTNNKIM